MLIGSERSSRSPTSRRTASQSKEGRRRASESSERQEMQVPLTPSAKSEGAKSPASDTSAASAIRTQVSSPALYPRSKAESVDLLIVIVRVRRETGKE